MSFINSENESSFKMVEWFFFSSWYTANQKPEFKITDTKLYVPVVTLSTQDNVKLLKQLEFGF